MTDNIAMADPFSYSSAAEVEGGAVIGRTLIEIAKTRDDIVLIAPDVGRGPATMPFIEAFPDRYIDVGIAESNAVSIGAGLAASGMRPVVFSIGAFLAPKCMEQIRTDVAINQLPVTMVAAWGGLDMGYFGPSHHGIEDISMLRGTPHLDIAFAADDHAMEALLKKAIADGRPIYIRAPAEASGHVYDEAPDFARGKARVLREGADIVLVGTGLGTSLAVGAALHLADEGVEAAVVDTLYLKPFDGETICRLAQGGVPVLTVEEHNVAAGLAALTAEALGRGGVATRFDAIGLPDGDLAVSVPAELYARYDLTVDGVTAKAREMAKR